MSHVVTFTSFADDTQQILPNPGSSRELDHAVIHEPSDQPIFLNVWVTPEEPVLPLLAADRLDRIPIAPGFGGTIPISQPGAFMVVSITTGDDATGAPTAPVFASFRWE